MPHALECISYNGEHCHGRNHRNTDPQVQHGASYDFRFCCAGDKAYRRRGKENHKNHSQKPPDKVDQQCALDAGEDAAAFPGTVILAGIGCHTGAEGNARCIEELCQTPGGHLCRDVDIAQRIDGALQKHAADVVERTHESHADAGPEHTPDIAEGDAEILLLKAQDRIFQDNVGEPENGADGLRGRCGNGGTANAHAQGTHAKKIQKNIQDTAEHEKQERGGAVAHRLQQTGFQVVAHGEGNREKNDGQIFHGTVENTALYLHGRQQRTFKQKKEGEHKKGSGQRENRHPGHG